MKSILNRDNMGLMDAIQDKKEERNYQSKIKDEQKIITKNVIEVGTLTTDCFLDGNEFDFSIIEGQIGRIKDAIRRIEEYSAMIPKSEEEPKKKEPQVTGVKRYMLD